MNRLLAFLISLIAGVIGTQPDPRAAIPAPPAIRVVGYLASWGVRSKGTTIADLPAADLTHIFYAFAEIAPDGSVTMANPCLDVGACGEVKTLPDKPAGNFGELRRLKRRYPHLKLTISIGGWGGSARFSDAALTEKSRHAFVRSAKWRRHQ